MGHKRQGWLVAVAASALLVVGCGGSAPSAGPQGWYVGSLTAPTLAPKTVSALVLDDNQAWLVYGGQSNGQRYITGFIQGPGSFVGRDLQLPNALDFGYATPLPAPATATLDPVLGTLTGMVNEPLVHYSLSLGPDDQAAYNYDQVPRLADLVGNWSATTLGSAVPVTLQVTSTGSWTLGSASTCTLSGSLAPRKSGKNVYDVQLAFGPSPCAAPGQTQNGVAVLLPQPGAKPQLLLLTVDAARSSSLLMLATQP